MIKSARRLKYALLGGSVMMMGPQDWRWRSRPRPAIRPR